MAGGSRSVRFFVLGAAIAAGLGGCGPGLAESGSSGWPIINGEPVPAEEHLAVVAISSPGGLCSGTLISRRVVLTAGHCLDQVDPEVTWVSFGPDLQDRVQVAVAQNIVHPLYSPRRILNDIALAKLAEDPPRGVEPAPYLPAVLGMTEADIGVPLEFVGFGQTEDGGTGRKMTVTNQLEWICPGPETCWVGPGYPAMPHTICFDMNPGGTCSGDSGGPAFLEREGLIYVAGITSYGGEGCVAYACSTQVDAYQEFIEDNLGASDGQPCSDDLTCASGRCRDGLCCDADCGGLCQRCDLAGFEGICQPLADGLACDDGTLCNGHEACLGGSCQPGEPLECADEVACTEDHCDPTLGCVFSPKVKECFDDQECTRDVCDPQLGCRWETLPDDTPCGYQGHCRQGVCQLPGDGAGCGCGASAPGGFGGVGLLGWWLALRARRLERRWTRRPRR